MMRVSRSEARFCYRVTQGLRIVFMLASITGCLLILQNGGAVATTACDEAKEQYAKGSKLLNFSERKEAFSKAVELCPDYAEAHVNLADAYENLGDFDAAEKHYSQAVALGLRSPIPFIGLGEVYLRTGRYGLAMDCYAKGCNIEPGNERLQAGLKVAEERMKREKTFFTQAQISSCLGEDEQFRLMCMCPGDQHAFLRKWICMPVVLFASGSAELSKDAARQLDEVGESLRTKELAQRNWLIIGHADNIGVESRNKRLSKNRADQVKRYLVDRYGIDSNRLRVVAFGAEQPRSANETHLGRTDNRRVEIVIEDL